MHVFANANFFFFLNSNTMYITDSQTLSIIFSIIRTQHAGRYCIFIVVKRLTLILLPKEKKKRKKNVHKIDDKFQTKLTRLIDFIQTSW